MKHKDIFNFLITNKDFRDWVLNPTSHRNMYWEKWIESNPEHEEAVKEARQLIINMDFEEEFLGDDKLEEILKNIISDKDSAASRVSKRGRSVWLGIAASIFILSSALLSKFVFPGSGSSFLSENNTYKEVSNPLGQKSKITLSDGSTVFLNGGSSLKFPRQFADNDRSIMLTGEAFFQVKHMGGKPFIVESKGLKTRVLGTSFNVRAFENEPEVDISLVEGKVQVHGTNSPKQVELLPGEQLKYNNEKQSFQTTSFDVEEVTAWKEGVLLFKDADFEEFVSSIRNWYGVEVMVKKRPQKKWRVNGRFEHGESLEAVLTGVEFTHEMNFKIEGKKVTLY